MDLTDPNFRACVDACRRGLKANITHIGLIDAGPLLTAVGMSTAAEARKRTPDAQEVPRERVEQALGKLQSAVQAKRDELSALGGMMDGGGAATPPQTPPQTGGGQGGNPLDALAGSTPEEIEKAFNKADLVALAGSVDVATAAEGKDLNKPELIKALIAKRDEAA